MRITLYKGCAITPDKNMMVDEIESYLGTLSHYDVPDPNYVKNDLNILLTVWLSQDYFEGTKFNYCRVQTDANTIYYYFIIDATWKSANAVQFSLNIDSVNTFRKDFESQWNEKTNILRQHEDRFKKISEGKYQKIINPVSEGIQGIQELTADETIRGEKQTDWYLVYTTIGEIDPNNPTKPLPVQCKLMPDRILIYEPESGYVGSVDSIKGLDRTDPKLIRIVACPYCPAPIVFDRSNPVITELPSFISFESGALIVSGVQLYNGFKHTIKGDGFSLDLYDRLVPTPQDTDLRRIEREPKLLHSDFRTERFQYDSFYRDFQLERVITPDDGTIDIDYVQSSDYNSNLLFKLNYPGYDRKDIYDNYLICKRNNERPILNSSYFNYLRNGYNYDKKASDVAQGKATRSLIASGITAVGGAATLATLATGVATGGVSLIVGAIGAIGAGIAGVINSANDMTLNANSFEQKQKQLQDTAAGVTTSDDFSLLQVYNGNKLHHYTLKLRPRDANIVWDLFHYCGYKKEERDIPNYNSRIWFNFIQCQPEFNEDKINKIAIPYLADIKARFAAGITVYHRRHNEYDFKQERENWEKTIVA